MTSKTLSRCNSKWSEVKIFFILHLFLAKCVTIASFVSFKKILSKSALLGSFPIQEGSQRESSLLPIGRLGEIYDSHPHSKALLYSHPDKG
jgi:hypothetical protein